MFVPDLMHETRSGISLITLRVETEGTRPVFCFPPPLRKARANVYLNLGGGPPNNRKTVFPTNEQRFRRSFMPKASIQRPLYVRVVYDGDTRYTAGGM